MCFLDERDMTQAGCGKSLGLPVLRQFQQNAAQQKRLLVIIPNRRELDHGGG